MTTRSTLLLALALAGPAHAGADKIPHYDLESAKELDKAAKTFGMSFEGKVKAFPAKVAIGSFQVRYGYDSALVTKDKIATIELTEEAYVELTGVLYDQMVAQLETDGFEVVPRAQVVATTAYAAIEADTDPKQKKAFARYTPEGMKNIKTLSGKPQKPGALVALNDELGTDAVLSVYSSFSLCNTDPSPSNIRHGVPPGAHICLRGRAGNPGLSISAYGGATRKGDTFKPEWTARVFKEPTPFEYSKRGKDFEIYDAAFIDRSTTATFNQNFWGRISMDVEAGVYMNGALEMFADALVVGLDVLYDKTTKARAAAGFATSTPTLWVRPFTNEARKQKESMLDEAARVAADGGAVPPLAGTVSCYVGSASSNGAHIGEVLLRRGVTDTSVVEDSVTLMEGQPPYRYVTTLAIDGTSLTATEAAGTWTGTGSFSPGWSSWSTELAMANGTTVRSEYAATDGTLTSTGAMLAADGSELATTGLDLAAVDDATCSERFSRIPVPAGAF